MRHTRIVVIIAAGAIAMSMWTTFASAQTAPAQPRRPTRPSPISDFRYNATAFVGVIPTPAIRGGYGFAFGGGRPGSGFELEIARTGSNLAKGAPVLATFTVNFFVDLPLHVRRFTVYGIGGMGIWNEQYEDGRGAGEFGTNIGAGLKTDLVGALKARIDYRLYFLNGSPDGSARFPHPSRIFVGICGGC